MKPQWGLTANGDKVKVQRFYADSSEEWAKKDGVLWLFATRDEAMQALYWISVTINLASIPMPELSFSKVQEG